MIDEKELEYKTIPLGSYLANPVSLFVGVPLLIVAIMVLFYVPDFTMPLSLLILGLGLLATFLYRHVESINAMKSKGILAAYGEISESERKSAFLQKYDAQYYGMFTNVIGKRYGAYYVPGIKNSRQQWEWARHQLITSYRIIILNKDRINIFEATTNDGKVKEKEIPVSSVKEITVWIPKVQLVLARKELVFTYKTKDKEEEKIFTHKFDFVDYEQFENTVRSLYGKLMAEQKTIL